MVWRGSSIIVPVIIPPVVDVLIGLALGAGGLALHLDFEDVLVEDGALR